MLFVAFVALFVVTGSRCERGNAAGGMNGDGSRRYAHFVNVSESFFQSLFVNGGQKERREAMKMTADGLVMKRMIVRPASHLLLSLLQGLLHEVRHISHFTETTLLSGDDVFGEDLMIDARLISHAALQLTEKKNSEPLRLSLGDHRLFRCGYLEVLS